MVKSIRNADISVAGIIQNDTPSENTPPPDPQVRAGKPYRTRRSYSLSCKARLVAAYEACQSSAERGAFLRREGLYYSSLSCWRKELAKGSESKHKGSHGRSEHLVREIAQLRKKLSQAETIIDLQKKISMLFGQSTHPDGSDEKSS